MLYSRLSVVILLVIIFFLGRAAFGAYQKYNLARVALSAALAKVAELEARKEFIGSEIERFKNERGIEGELRRKFDVAKPGEEVIVIIEPGATTSQPR